MKINNLYKMMIGLLLCAPLFQSCLKDDDEIFDKNPSQRLQEYMAEAKEVLMSAEKGWLLEMYPHSKQAYGGYAFIVRFDEEKVYASSEFSDSDVEVSSLYKMTDDDGPVLSFDTYNALLHLLSTPSSSNYQAFQGEFEFVVLSATPDLVTLRGKKTNNIMYMRKMTESQQTYLDKLNAIDNSLILSGFGGTVGGTQVVGTIDTDYRQITFTPSGGDPVKTSYSMTDEGLRLYTPVEVSGVKLEEFIIDPETNSLTGKGSDVVFNAVFPEGWRAYDKYEGNYILNFNNNLVEVTLTPAGDGISYLMSGLNSQFDVQLKWVRSSGCLEWLSQKIGMSGSKEIWLCAWDAQIGTLTWNTAVGMRTVWNNDEQNPVYTWEDNGMMPGNTINSYIMWMLSGGSSAGEFRNSSYYITGTNSNRIPYVYTLTKVD